MKAEIIYEEPKSPPVKEVVLRLSPGEAKALRAVAGWHGAVADAVRLREAQAMVSLNVSRDTINNTLLALWGELFEVGLKDLPPLYGG